MGDLADPAVARAALEDATTDASELRLIAQNHPELRAQVAMHPAAYAGLLDWLESLGDPLLTAVVNVRRGAEGGRRPLVDAGAPTPPGRPGVMTSPAGAPRRHRKKLFLGLGAAVVALILVATGFVTRGFGLLPAGGSATPEEEALKVANKTVELLNSFSVSNLLSNPLTAMGSLTSEYAPSEVRLTSSLTAVDTGDLLGLTRETVELLAELAGSFKVSASDLQTETSLLTDDIAVVSFVEGTVTVTADSARLRTALPKVPAAASAQLVATAELYGLHPGVNLDGQFPAGWVDDTMAAVEHTFPLTVDLADTRNWDLNPLPPASGDSSGGDNPLVMVRDGGRWYLSSMLTPVALNGGLWWRSAPDDPSAAQARKEMQRLAQTEPSLNASPVAAAEGMAEALGRADERAITRQLPLAERRLAAVSRVLSTLESSGPVDVDYEFSELARKDQQARVRIDELSVNSASGFAIEDGSCAVVAGTSYCLKDALDQQSLDDGIDYLRWTARNAGEYQSQAFEEATGIDLDEFIDKVELAAEGAAEALHPDELGIISVQEDGGWFISVTATVSDLQNQAGKALSAGLKAAQKG